MPLIGIVVFHVEKHHTRPPSHAPLSATLDRKSACLASAADEHFNDLIRKGNGKSKLIVVDPTLEDIVRRRVCHVVDQDPAELEVIRIGRLECRRGGRVTFVKAKAENLNKADVAALLLD